MSQDKAEKANIPAKEISHAPDEPMLEPSLDPLVNMSHKASQDDHDPEGLGPMSLGMAERIKQDRCSRT
ncbi:hypothetical protein [Microvirga roseola]|uniref:hypothetical protein n=1 Tax=Microvirga roseola TaxID=2883126 RepID=UPI001E446843|nr:hypothetical protein [Microvirga roseola]